MNDGLLAVIEGGGTHFNCALIDGAGAFVAEEQVSTTAPIDTLSQCAAFFEREARSQPLCAAGIACFGPLVLEPEGDDHGKVLGTPKPGWEGFNPRAFLEGALQVPVAITTDVAGSALGEMLGGAARDLRDFVYVTVGTGIGAAVVSGGQVSQGATHFEFGHIPVKRASNDAYAGHCVFHGDCLSGLACGPAIQERWNEAGETLPPDHQAWVMEADYLAQLCQAAIYSYAPQAIILGGGVMGTPGLLQKVQRRLIERLGDYHCEFFGQGPGFDDCSVSLAARISRGLMAPGAGARSALIGASHLARGLLDDGAPGRA